MIRVGVVGLGKMGLSHHALLGAHPDVDLVGVCDSAGYVLGVLKKNTGVATFGDYEQMLEQAKPDAVLIATPTSSHVGMVRAALERDVHVFCEKPLTLDPDDAEMLAALAAERGLVTQVGYHNRFVAAFREVRRLLDARRDRRGHPRPRRGLRAGRAQGQGQNLAQPVKARAAAASTTTPPT